MQHWYECQVRVFLYYVVLSIHSSRWKFKSCLNLFAEQDKHLSKVNTTTQIVVQVRLMLMKKLNLSDHIT